MEQDFDEYRNEEEDEEEAGRGRKRPRKQANPGRFYFRVMTATALV
jgi:hypothetical protein